jgi:formate/nitrite transporter FocA (FNT family)
MNRMNTDRQETNAQLGHVESTPNEKHEEASVYDATRLSARLIYEVIRRDGEEELERPFVSLIWSGLAAGMLISFSVLGEAILRSYLPDAPASFLIENLGYSLGFLVVILGRMQLFTENTITTVLPVVARRSMSCTIAMLRLWSVVLAANVAGAMLAAFFMTLPGAFSDEVSGAIRELSHHAVGMGASQSFIRAIPAGVLVASIVWMMPSSRGSEFFIILTFTWAIAAGDLTHIIAGSVEMGYLLLLGELPITVALFDFFVPVLAGNIVGGTAIFTLLAWGQVKNEVEKGTGAATGR